MKVALVNPPWNYEGSIYFGSRDPHLPLELGYTAALLRHAGHETLLLDGQLQQADTAALAHEIIAFAPDMTVVTTAPTYLFWRCAPPELRVPRAMMDAVRGRAGKLVAVGPHGSTTPAAALRKLDADAVVMGECEEIVPMLLDRPWAEVPSVAFRSEDGRPLVRGGPYASRFIDLPPLAWPQTWIDRHANHHHRFDGKGFGVGAEVEASRGCPYSCTFCAKENFRNAYRRRAIDKLLPEIDALIEQGVGYIYFIDEIFLPNRQLLEALVSRRLEFGVQTRIDLWKPEMLELLGRAGCVSIEAGVESITEEGRASLDKDCKLSTDELSERLLVAKRVVPFVQANLLMAPMDDPAAIAEWRDGLRAQGVWANDPVPLFPYPGSPDYRNRWGLPDDQAWERAHEHYLERFDSFSDIQEQRPLPLAELEAACH